MPGDELGMQLAGVSCLSPSSPRPQATNDAQMEALVGLLRWLKEHDYRFTTVTPETHALVNQRPGNAQARSLSDVLGHNRPFRREMLPPSVFEALRAADGCEPEPDGEWWRATLRISGAGGELFCHSSFPTREADAVFFGPDSYRFVRAVLASAEPAARVVDVGCGTGIAGILLSKSGRVESELILADVNARALRAAAVNSEAAGVRATIAESDVLGSIPGEVDLILANPPYMNDASRRAYRHGGGAHGEALGIRIVREGLARLAQNPRGGTLLVYTGAPVRDGRDLFFAGIEADLQRGAVSHTYEELDPDVFSSELRQPAYEDVERIAAVFLRARVTGRA